MTNREKRLPLTHAEDANGDINYVLDVPNGDNCGCRCPVCNEPLRAKHGHKDENENGHIPHFAHKSGTDMCDGAQMSIMHLQAQRLIKERKFVKVPRYGRIEEKN